MHRSFVILMLVAASWLGTSHALRAQDGTPAAAGTPVYLPFIVDGNDAAAQTDNITDEQDDKQSETLDDEATPPLIVRIFFDSAETLAELIEEFDVLEQPATNGYVTALVSQEEWERLSTEGYRAEIDSAQTEQLVSALAQRQQAQVQSAATLAERDRLASELDVWEVHRQEHYLIARLDAGAYLTLAFSGWHISLECERMRQLQSALNLEETTLQQICPLQEREEG